MVNRGISNVTALNALGISFVHLWGGQLFHSCRNVRETRHCRVQGPEPDRPTTTKARLAFIDQRSVKTDAVGADTDGLHVTGFMNGMPVRFMVDTGANIAIIKVQTWEAISRSSESTPRQLEHVLDTMKLADRRSSSFLGRGTMTLRLGDRELDHTLWVAEIESEGILGLDFLRQYDCRLVLKDGCYELQFGDVSEAKRGKPLIPSCFRVSVDHTAVVPPRSEALVAGKIVGPCAPVLGLLEPTARLMEVNHLMLARSLVDTASGIIPLRV